MAFDTVRGSKMRSALTVLGVVIGITSIVGMTAMIRGFDQSLRQMIAAIGPNTIFVQRFGITSFAGGAEFKELMKRPNLSISDARALEEQADTIQFVDIELGAGGPPTSGASSTAPEDQGASSSRSTRELRRGDAHPDARRPLLQRHRAQYRKNVASSATPPYQLLFAPSGTDPVGKTVRIGRERLRVVGVFDKRPAPAASTSGRTTSSSSLYRLSAHLRPQPGAGESQRDDPADPDRARAARRASARRRRSPTSSG
jgi:putative ABC transport system permease protein